MFFGDHVSEISLAARQRFRQDRLGIRIEENYARSRRPRFEQYIRILNGRRPSESVSVTVKAFDDVHVFAVEIATELVKPTGAVETDGVDNHRVSFPVANRFSVPGP